MAEASEIHRRPARRRSAEDARRVLLEATERRLEEVGPDGIRLKDVAGSVGVSHTLLLHHFGTREGLLEAVVARRISKLRSRLIDVLSDDKLGSDEMRHLLEHVCEVVGDPVQVRVLGWLGLAGQSRVKPTGSQSFRRIAAALHDARVSARTKRGEPLPPFEDSLFLVFLAAAAIVGERLLEPVLLPSVCLEEMPELRERYRHWLSERLTSLLHTEG